MKYIYGKRARVQRDWVVIILLYSMIFFMLTTIYWWFRWYTK